MHKKINFNLNKFPVVPNRLRHNPSINAAANIFEINLDRLYHHYHNDFWGISPSNANYSNFNYLSFLHSSEDFRFLAERVSINGAHKRTISYTLGQTFCRYFLYEFCNITYFAHMDKVLNKKTHPAFDGLQVKRISNGDVPDYLCAESVNSIFIGEAKGRFENISFTSSEFQDWRNQFDRIKVYDKHNIPKKVKGYIVGTKFTTNKNANYNKSKILVEDPETKGEEQSKNDFLLGRGCIAIHYSNIISKLGLEFMAYCLEEGLAMPRNYEYDLPIWQCNHPALKGQRFVGGYLSDERVNFRQLDNNHLIYNPNIFRVKPNSPFFYGIEENLFRIVKKASQGDWEILSEIRIFDVPFEMSGVSVMRDGTINGKIDYFEFVGYEPL